MDSGDHAATENEGRRPRIGGGIWDELESSRLSRGGSLFAGPAEFCPQLADCVPLKRRSLYLDVKASVLFFFLMVIYAVLKTNTQILLSLQCCAGEINHLPRINVEKGSPSCYLIPTCKGCYLCSGDWVEPESVGAWQETVRTSATPSATSSLALCCCCVVPSVETQQCICQFYLHPYFFSGNCLIHIVCK